MPSDRPKVTRAEAADLRSFRGRYWNEEAIAEAFERWRSEYGQPPSYADWRHVGEWWPSRSTIRQVYGSWRAFQRAMSLTPSNKPAEVPVSYTDEEILRAIRSAFKVGHRTSKHFRRRGVSPSLSLICLRFNSWQEAVRAAGLVPLLEAQVAPEMWDEAWLRHHYVELQMTTREISLLVFGTGSRVSSVHNALRRAGIPTRPRGAQSRRGAA